MRAFILLLPLVACTPDVLPDTYKCGPDGLCPEGQQCNPADGRCVLPARIEPFACEPDLASEPDDTVETAFELVKECNAIATPIEACMTEGDPGDWYKFTVPADCANPMLDTRITFPIAFEQLGVELVDLATNATIATDAECPSGGEIGNEIRCLTAPLTAGASYGVHVAPTGDGDCDGDCAFNRYTVSVALGD
jgi:hypothetical protein